MVNKHSPFLNSGPSAAADQLAIIHLKRDLQIPVILREHDDDDEGYAEGKVLNTRFGNFPHSTLIGLPWGSQVRASKVDTGSRGRRKKIDGCKRKREEDCGSSGSTKDDQSNKKFFAEDLHDAESNSLISGNNKEEKEAVAASSGFIHLLPPTPENWTSSLPHRTQVVYTPDYSYILHRLRARPGSRLIEAGAGSGSFTHAAARAVFNGHPEVISSNSNNSFTQEAKFGKVWSFEFHEQRYQKLQEEIQDHGLEGIVEITYRDVCTDGFLIKDQIPSPNAKSESTTDISSSTLADSSNCGGMQKKIQTNPMATAVFLDLPAPWLALPHLTRSSYTKTSSDCSSKAPGSSSASPMSSSSVLDPSSPVHICTFSPCIEQVQRTVSVMRRLGWVDINTVEVNHKRFEVRREHIGLSAKTAPRSLQTTLANVDEAVARLIEVEKTFKAYHEKSSNSVSIGESNIREEVTLGSSTKETGKKTPYQRENVLKGLVEGKSYKEGRLVHRTETELKTHTSYLVFAVLPQEWSEADEALAKEKWPFPLEGVVSGADFEKVMSGQPSRREEDIARETDKNTPDDSVENTIDS